MIYHLMIFLGEPVNLLLKLILQESVERSNLEICSHVIKSYNHGNLFYRVEMTNETIGYLPVLTTP